MEALSLWSDDVTCLMLLTFLKPSKVNQLYVDELLSVYQVLTFSTVWVRDGIDGEKR